MGTWIALGEAVWLIGLSTWIILERRSPMDNRSFRLNFEIAAVFYDRELAGSLAATFHTDLSQAASYRLGKARRVPFWQRLVEAAARLLSPLL
jgi:cardiolipin synthase A/B